MADVELRETGLEATRPEVESGGPGAGVAGGVHPRQGKGDDLLDRIFEVRLETERVRTDLAKLSDRMMGESGKLRMGMGEMRSELVDRMMGESGKLRVEMGEMRSELVDRMMGEAGKLRVEMGEMRSELVDRMDRGFARVWVEMGNMDTKLTDRISGVEVNLRAEITELKKSAGRWMAFGMSFITVLVALVGLLS